MFIDAAHLKQTIIIINKKIIISTSMWFLQDAPLVVEVTSGPLPLGEQTLKRSLALLHSSGSVLLDLSTLQ